MRLMYQQKTRITGVGQKLPLSSLKHRATLEQEKPSLSKIDTKVGAYY